MKVAAQVDSASKSLSQSANQDILAHACTDIQQSAQAQSHASLTAAKPANKHPGHYTETVLWGRSITQQGCLHACSIYAWSEDWPALTQAYIDKALIHA